MIVSVCVCATHHAVNSKFNQVSDYTFSPFVAFRPEAALVQKNVTHTDLCEGLMGRRVMKNGLQVMEIVVVEFESTDF